MDKLIIAIDGPSGTGKSTTARMLSEKIGIPYVDSGAFYRAITYSVLKNNLKVETESFFDEFKIGFNIELKENKIFLNGKDISSEIRSLEVTNRVSTISKNRNVRKLVLGKLRDYASENGVVMDGRDIGTVVFPNANFKFFLICDLKTRAARRQQDFLDLGQKIPIEKVVLELKKRDDIDSKRADAPLKKSQDAIEVDTTNMIIEEQVNFLYQQIFKPETE